MTVYIYAESVVKADGWARAQDLAPRQFRAFGRRSSVVGTRFRAGDRIVIVGQIPGVVEDSLRRDRCKVSDGDRPDIERV